MVLAHSKPATLMPLAAPNSPHRNSELIAKYDVPGPRYTSYPTALQFDERFTAADYAALWQRPATVAPLSLYVHIPFCSNICHYCACNKIATRDADAARRYLSYLEREIDLQSRLAGKSRPVTQMHWGGGTPTFLKPAELTELMYAIGRRFQLIDDTEREYSIEIDPRTVVSEDLALLKGLGFNRLSFGVQDLDERVLAAVNRRQSAKRLVELYDAARSYDFSSISMDLIYGLPHQSIASLQKTFQQIVALQPDRIALYNYEHLPARFPGQSPIDRLPLPTAQEKLSMLALAFEQLGAAGYAYIGMDHFVRPNDSLAVAQAQGRLQRNFQGYSTCLAPDLVGLGVSAIGSTAAGYAQNQRELPAYCGSLERGELPIARGLKLTADDCIRRYVIARIICDLHLDIEATEQWFGIHFDTYFRKELPLLHSLAADCLIERRGKQLDVTETGRPFLRNICMVFDRYLPHAEAP
jgi:oxygen-independent coproporphyrinogen-3 oxidase